jgi:DNA modification methylase
MMRWLVARASLEGMTVCDPFMGSGTTGIACVGGNRKFIGIEKDPRHFETARKRIENALQQRRLL